MIYPITEATGPISGTIFIKYIGETSPN